MRSHRYTYMYHAHPAPTEECSQAQCTLHPINHSDMPPSGFVSHQLPTICWYEETPVLVQKICPAITIHPDMNILQFHFTTTLYVIPITEI